MSEELKPCKDEATHAPTFWLHRHEIESMAAYRKQYPDGVAWQELSSPTRAMWIEHVYDNAQRTEP